MKGLGHPVSKRDSSPIGCSCDKKTKLSPTEEPMVDRCQKPFSSLSLNEVLVLEIFAGSARLTAAVRDAGMQGIAVDYDKTRSSGPHIAVYDLNDPSQFESLVEFIKLEKHRIVWVHFAPSCGTASRARERPLKSWERKGYRVPKPLRSDQFPLGVPGLKGIDKHRTETANITYSQSAILAAMLHEWGITISTENPLRSIFSMIPDIVDLVSRIGGYETVFDHCCHGGLRDKSTMWWSNRDWFLSLAQRCDKSHNHAKWNPEVIDGKTVFPTHQEASYPILLCQRLAAIIKDHAFSMGAHDVTSLQQQLEETSTSGHRFILGMLPRGKKFKPLVSEYGAYQKHVFKMNQSAQHDKVLQTLPKGCKILHRRLQRGVLRDNAIISDESNKATLKGPLDTTESKDDAWYNGEISGIHDSPFNGIHYDMDGSYDTFEVLSIGIPRDPMDFVEKAVKAGHPRSMSVHLPTVVQDMLRENFEHSPLVLMKKRTAFFWKWTKRAKELCADEIKYKSSLPSHLQSLHRRKKLLLWAEILESLEYPDRELIRHVAEGFQISGSGIKCFPQGDQATRVRP